MSGAIPLDGTAAPVQNIAGGSTVTGIAPGVYAVEPGSVAGYQTPAAVEVIALAAWTGNESIERNSATFTCRPAPTLTEETLHPFFPKVGFLFSRYFEDATGVSASPAPVGAIGFDQGTGLFTYNPVLAERLPFELTVTFAGRGEAVHPQAGHGPV